VVCHTRLSHGVFSLIVVLAIAAGVFRLRGEAAPSRPGRSLPAQAPVWTECHAPVAHALGAIDGTTYTNSLEAFAANYARGFRVFEVDLARTRDGSIVALHEWRNIWPTVPSLAEFKARKIAGRYTPATLIDVLTILQSHPDVYLVVDFKGEIPDLLPDVVAAARAMDPELPMRVIPQVSTEAEAEAAGELYRFPSEILTLYRTRASDAEVVALAARTGIQVVTMSTSRFNEALVRRLDSLGVRVYVHTVNDRDSETDLRAKGVWGIYTDTLGPEAKAAPCSNDSSRSP